MGHTRASFQWKIRREMMMEIDPAEMTLSNEHQPGGDIELIDGVKMMTIWTEVEREGIESIEHLNIDIIMEDLGVTLMDTCMDVDVETAWSEMEMMEGIKISKVPRATCSCSSKTLDMTTEGLRRCLKVTLQTCALHNVCWF
jgi:hypothetical protein